MYDGDAPLAERRAGALTLDRDLLRELLGQEELRELLDPEALADLELSLQALTDDRKATTADQAHDLLRRLGDLSADELAARCEGGAAAADALDRGSRRVPPRGPCADRRRAALDRDRGRRSLPRRRRGRASGRRPGCVPRPGDGFARWAAGALRPNPRTVPDPGSGPALGPAGRRCRGSAGAVARERDDPPRRVPARRRRARVARPGRAPDPPPPLAGPAPSRGRARRSGGAWPVPAGVAWRRLDRRGRCAAPSERRHRAPRGGRRPARRPADPGVGPGARRAAGADSGLPAAVARRARGDGRGCLGGAGESRSRRRPDRARPARARGAPTDRTASMAPTAPPVPATRRFASTSPGGAPRSTGSCSLPPAAARTATSSTRSGTSSGPARSRTTRSPRCGPFAGSGPHATRAAGRAG